MKHQSLGNSIFHTVKYPMPSACQRNQPGVFAHTDQKKLDTCAKTPPSPCRPWIFILLPAILALGLRALTPTAARSTSNDTETIWCFTSFGENDYFFRPSDIAVNPIYERIYIADSGNHRIVVFDFDGKHLNSIGREGQGPGEFSRPTGLCILPDSDLAVADFGNTRIQIFSRDGEFKQVIGTHGIKAADIIMHEGLFFTIPSFGESGFALNLNSEETTQPVITVIDPKTLKIVDEIACDSNIRAFSPVDAHRLVTIYEDPEGELTLKCARI